MALTYLDIETTSFFDDPHIKRLPRSQQIRALASFFGVALTYDDQAGWRTWTPGQVADLWAALRGQTICGWNVVNFDVPIIQGAAALAGYSDPGLDPWYALDLFAECRTRTGRWYKLDMIASMNLGKTKSANGQLAAEWLRSNDPALVFKAANYCRRDVELVMELHALAQTTGLLLPPTGKERETPGTFRLWLNADGTAWKLADEDRGIVIDQERWAD